MPTKLHQREEGSNLVINPAKNALWKHVGSLKNSSAQVLFLSSVSPGGLTVSQMAFFLMAAAADANGNPATQSQIIDAYGESLSKAIRNTYRQLLEPTRSYPKALGWLTKEADPNDERAHLLRLTDKGRDVIEGVLMASGVNDV